MPDQYDRAKLKQTNVRLSRLGNELLDKVTEYHGITKTAVFDMLLREHARELGLLVAPAPAARLEEVDADDDEPIEPGARVADGGSSTASTS